MSQKSLRGALVALACSALVLGAVVVPARAVETPAAGDPTALSIHEVELNSLGKIVDEAMQYDWGSVGYGVSGFVVSPHRDDVRGVFKGADPVETRLGNVEQCTDRFLAALHLVDRAGALKEIVFEDTTYHWSSGVTDGESRWVSAQRETLVDEMMSCYPHEGYGLQLTLRGEGNTGHYVYLSFMVGGLTSAINRSDGGDVVLFEDFTEDVIVEAGSASSVEGRGHTLRGSVEIVSASENPYLTVLIFSDLTFDGDINGDGRADTERALLSDEHARKEPNSVILDMYDCVIRNYLSGAGYFTNLSYLTVDGCSFEDVSSGLASGSTETGENKGALSFNLINDTGRSIEVLDSRFSGACGTDAVISVAARGGESDAGAQDVLPGTNATLEKLTVTGCTFSCDGAPATVKLGTDSKADEGKAGATSFAKNETGDFSAEISGNKTGMTILPAYKTYRTDGGLYDTSTGAPVQLVTLLSEGVAKKDKTGDVVVVDSGTESSPVPDPTPDPDPTPVPGTVTNPDGSTTTTTVEESTNPSNGHVTTIVTEATEGRPDGSTTTVVTETVTAPSGAKTKTVTETNTLKNGTTATAVSDDKGVSTVAATVTSAAVQAGTVVLPVTALPARSDAKDAVSVSVTVPAGGATIVVPVVTASGVTGAPASASLALVEKNGDLTVIPKVATSEEGLVIAVDESATYKLIDASTSYPDVTGGEWFAAQGVVGFVTSRGIMSGEELPGGGTAFNGLGGTNRAMFATMLHRLELSPKVTGVPAFDDVSPEDWFAGSALWASSVGVVEGYDDGGFGGVDPVTREQMAVMLYRYANWLELDTSASADLGFPDAGEVSGWAKEAMSWAVAEGLFSGNTTTGELNPTDGATRAEAAAVLMRFINNVLY